MRLLASSCLSVRPSVRMEQHSSPCPSICPHGTARLPLDGYSWNLIFEFFENASIKLKCHLNLTRMTGTVRKDQYRFLIICRWTLGMRNVWGKSCIENQNTHFMFNSFFSPENRAVYEKMWKSIVEPDRPHVTIGHMCIARWITKSKNTHSEYVILIAFPLQQWLEKRSLVLRCSTLAVLYVYVCTVHLVYSFYFNQQCTIYIN